mgnify:CR=1 FL=1
MKILIATLSLLFVLLAAELSFASEVAHGDGHDVSIPFSVTLQAINFGLYAALLFFLLRKPVKSYFRDRETAFSQALVKAKQAKDEAEQKKREVQDRLTQLQSTADQSVREARAEAELLKTKIIAEAQDMAKRLREEAQRSAAIEIERAKTELREELLDQSVALSQKILKEKMAEPDQKRLQTEFVDKIGVRS